jgi:cardiolipin synthase
MYYEQGEIMDKASFILTTAAQNGLDARLHYDWFSLSFAFGKYLVPGSASFKAKRGCFDELAQRGVAVTLTNPPKLIQHLFPFLGRNHMKITVIDNVAYLGGLNYSDADFKSRDFMIKITEPALVEALATLFLRVEHEKLQNKKINIDHETALLIDNGKSGSSIILDEAVEAVRASNVYVYHTSQYVPDGKFLKALNDRYKHHMEIKVITPAKNGFNPVFSFIYKFNRITMSVMNRKIPIRFMPMMIHSKLTVIDDRVAFIGSHNLLSRGVRAGTSEVMLISHNETLIHNVKAYFLDLEKS